ncbi:MAG: hypothetical protein KDE15_07490 [Erythrobacter sp.]|nr:hypothetical protein [Erythrobacter sp.]
MPCIPAHRARRRPPFFQPVPLRARADGWSVARQGHFLAHLYLTGSVAAAARMVGMSRESAYRLRARAGAESFAQAWDHVLTPPGSGRVARPSIAWRKVTLAALAMRIEMPLVQPLIHRGKVTTIREKWDNSALSRLLRRADALARRVERRGQGG